MAKDSDDGKWILYTSLGIGVFIGGKALLAAIGINPADQKIVDSVNTLAKSQNPFSPTFGYDYNDANDNDTDVTADITANSFNPALVQNLIYWTYGVVTDPSHFTSNPLLIAGANNGNAVYNALGVFSVDENAISTVFAGLQSQFEVSLIAQFLLYGYNLDLWTILTKGNSWLPFTTGVYTSTLAKIVQHVQSLPVYPPAWGEN